MLHITHSPDICTHDLKILHALSYVASCHTSGRSDPGVLKIILLATALDPPNWNRTLEAAKKAKSLGIRIGVTARGDDAVNEENFWKLSSGRMVMFGDERQHLKRLHEVIKAGSFCRIMNTVEPVCINIRFV